MFAILTLLLVVTFSLLVTRTAAVALTYTGLSQEAARFQSRSAFTGVGYTTSEAETVVNHPVRRRIVMLLMLVGNAGIVTAISVLILSFVNQSDTEAVWIRIPLLIAGLAVIFGLTKIPWVDRGLHRLIEKALKKWTDIDARDYEQLLHLSGTYGVSELVVGDNDWLGGKTIAEIALDEEGLAILGVHRSDGSYLGVPAPTTTIEQGDRLILYGCATRLSALDRRCAGEAGDRMHDEACRLATEDSRSNSPSKEL